MSRASDMIDSLLEGLDLEVLGIIGETLFLSINGRKYGYEPLKLEVGELLRKFKKMLGFSKGRALAWLKKNTKLASGSVKGIPTVARGTPAERYFKESTSRAHHLIEQLVEGFVPDKKNPFAGKDFMSVGAVIKILKDLPVGASLKHDFNFSTTIYTKVQGGHWSKTSGRGAPPTDSFLRPSIASKEGTWEIGRVK